MIGRFRLYLKNREKYVNKIKDDNSVPRELRETYVNNLKAEKSQFNQLEEVYTKMMAVEADRKAEYNDQVRRVKKSMRDISSNKHGIVLYSTDSFIKKEDADRIAWNVKLQDEQIRHRNFESRLRKYFGKYICRRELGGHGILFYNRE